MGDLKTRVLKIQTLKIDLHHKKIYIIYFMYVFKNVNDIKKCLLCDILDFGV